MNDDQQTHGSAQRPVDKISLYGCTPVTVLPGGWRRYIHINGGVYYHHAEHRIITECDVSEEKNRKMVMEDWEEVMQGFRDDKILWYTPGYTEVILRYYERVDGGDESDDEDGDENKEGPGGEEVHVGEEATADSDVLQADNEGEHSDEAGPEDEDSNTLELGEVFLVCHSELTEVKRGSYGNGHSYPITFTPAILK